MRQVYQGMSILPIKTVRNLALLLFVFSLTTSSLRAQDATVYVSNYDIGKTMSNILFSIDKNGFTYMNTYRKKAEPVSKEDYSGRIQIITFESEEEAQIIGCEPTAALGFPMKIVVWEEEGDIFISYVNPIFLKRRYHVSGCDEAIQELNKRMIRVVNDAIRR